MKYFHRTSITPDEAMARAAAYFGERLTPTEEGPRRLRFRGRLGELTVTVEAEGGHYTRIGLATDQPGESELDKLAKRFLTLVHAAAHPLHAVRGAY